MATFKVLLIPSSVIIIVMAATTVSAQLAATSCSIVSMCVLLQVSYTVSEYSPYGSLSYDNLFINPYETDDVYEAKRDEEFLPTDKRYASLSYYYGNHARNKATPRYYHNRYYRSRYYQNYHKPWLNLEDRECFRESCDQDKDCCKRFNKCDRSAHVCINCWYGYPCRKSRDCCERYPHCDKTLGACTT